jgi:hypothetical protein
MIRWRTVTAAAVASLLVLGACGGGGDDDTNVAAAKATTTTTTDAPAGSDGGTDEADEVQNGAVGTGLAERCLSYSGFAASIGLAMAAAMNPAAAAEIEGLRGKADLDDAPEELRDDFEVMIGYAEEMGKILAKYPAQNGAMNPAAMTAMGEYAESVDQAEIDAAGRNINDWLESNCPD